METTTTVHERSVPLDTSSRHFGSGLDWHRRISWGAIIAGFIVAVFSQLLLTLLGIGIGASAVDLTHNNTNGQGIAIGSGIYYVVSLLISCFLGGWVAGRLAKDKHTSESLIHGLLVVGMYALFTFYLLSSAIGNIIGGAGSFVSQNISSAAPSISDAVNKYSGNDQKANQDAAAATEKAKQVADAAATATSRAAFFAFIALLLGAGAGAWGAKYGRDSKEGEYEFPVTNQVHSTVNPNLTR